MNPVLRPDHSGHTGQLNCASHRPARQYRDSVRAYHIFLHECRDTFFRPAMAAARTTTIAAITLFIKKILGWWAAGFSAQAIRGAYAQLNIGAIFG